MSTQVVSKWKALKMAFITTITNTCGDVIRWAMILLID